jgi:hypothetical protein
MQAQHVETRMISLTDLDLRPPQIIARIDTPNRRVRATVHELLCKIGKVIGALHTHLNLPSLLVV